jgi:hypothetical protein
MIFWFLAYFPNLIFKICFSDSEHSIRGLRQSTVEKIDSLKAQNNELKERSIELSDKIETQAETIDKLRIENADLYAKLAASSKEIYSRITGGDSYCVFEVFFDGANKPLFNLKLVGTTPLKNVTVTIQDLARRVFLIERTAKNDWSSPLVPQINSNTTYGLQYPSIYPNTSIENIPIPVEDDQKDIRMIIWIYLDNGGLFETLEVSNFRDNRNRNHKLELRKGDEILLSR